MDFDEELVESYGYLRAGSTEGMPQNISLTGTRRYGGIWRNVRDDTPSRNFVGGRGGLLLPPVREKKIF